MLFSDRNNEAEQKPSIYALSRILKAVTTWATETNDNVKCSEQCGVVKGSGEQPFPSPPPETHSSLLPWPV